MGNRIFGLSLVSPDGPSRGASITPFGPGAKKSAKTIHDPAARLGNRIAVCAGDPMDPNHWRPAKVSDLLMGQLTLAGLARAIALDLGADAAKARAILGDLISESSEVGRGLSGRTIALAIAGDAALIVPPYAPKRGATALRPDGSSLAAAFGNVSDGTPTGVLSVKPLTANGRSAGGGLTLTIRKPRTATVGDLAACGLEWDDVVASAIALDARDKRDETKRPDGQTWLGITMAAMEASFAEDSVSANA